VRKPVTTTLVLGNEQVGQAETLLSPDDWYALVFETAQLIREHIAMSGYEALHYAARWLRGNG